MAEAEPMRELFECALDGDRDALADLYVQHGELMRRWIASSLRQLKIAWFVEPDDVFSSFFVCILEGRVKIHFASATHFASYCENAFRNECLQTLRSVILRTATNIDECPPEWFGDPSAANEFARLSWNEQLERTFAQLTHLERVVCFDRIDGQSWQEIGERLGKSAEAVRKVYQRAAERLVSGLLAGGGGG